jgi:hypothetical protein
MRCPALTWPDDRLDGGSSTHLAADGGADAADLAADPDAEFVRVVVAAIALVDMDAAGIDAGQHLQPGDHRSERVPVVRVAVQRLGVQHELTAPGAAPALILEANLGREIENWPKRSCSSALPSMRQRMSR